MAQERQHRVNQALGKQANYLFLRPEHVFPAAFSVFFAFGLYYFTGVGLLGAAVLGCWPFFTWVVVTRNNPKRFLAKFEPTPAWRRGRFHYKYRLRRNTKPGLRR